MKSKPTIRLIVDVLMTISLFLLMGYQLWGDIAHEWIGAGMLLLFIAHHILNLHWYKNLFKGKYTAARVVGICIDFLVLITMLAQMYSGIVMSRHVFDFLPLDGGMALARRVHILGSYWGFLFMSLHLGMHWNMLAGIFRKMLSIKQPPKQPSKILTAAFFAASLLLAGYGIAVFIKREFLSYLFLKTEFVFLDYSEPAILFYLDYLALMGSCIFAAHYIPKLFQRVFGQKEVTR